MSQLSIKHRSIKDAKTRSGLSIAGETSTIREKRFDHDFGQKSSFFQIQPIKKAMLRLSPKSLQKKDGLGVDDYG